MARSPQLPKTGPLHGNQIPMLPVGRETSAVRGEITFSLPGTHSWTVPTGVTSVSVVCVGGGSSGYGYNSGNAAWGGAGGGLGYKNDISVTAGDSLEVIVGQGGVYVTNSPASTPPAACDGGDSHFIDSSTCVGEGGELGSSSSTGGSYTGDGGGDGGAGGYSSGINNSGSGGGAGGYSGNGGAGVAGTSDTDGNAGSGGGGGSGAIGDNGTAAGGGGTGLYGEGTSGSAGSGGATSAGGGGGGSSGADADTTFAGSNALTEGARYGGGGSGVENGAQYALWTDGGDGAVRIVWPGSSRQFPSTDVGQS